MTIRERLEDRFGKQGLHWACLGRDGEHKLRTLTEMALGRWKAHGGEGTPTIIEIGTHQGVSACILADYGNVITFDPRDWPMRRDVTTFLGKNDRVEFRRIPVGSADDCTMPNVSPDAVKTGNEWLARELPRIDAALAFVDGNHQRESVRANFDAVRHTGAVIFHDYSYNEFHRERTVRVVNNIRQGRITKAEPFALWEDVQI